MNKPLFLFVGKSASGKTTAANFLEEKYDHIQVQSYTTRPPRYEGETGHIFVTDNEFDGLGELAAYTEYNGNRYGTTVEQLNKCTIYVIDVPGVETLLEKYNLRSITSKDINMVNSDVDANGAVELADLTALKKMLLFFACSSL